jgi:hypothetical protein
MLGELKLAVEAAIKECGTYVCKYVERVAAG